MMSSQVELRRLTVLVLSQGDDPLPQGVVDALRHHDDVSSWVEFRLVKEAKRSSGGTVFSRLAQLVQAADIAIAVLTQDVRPASSAGNLWHEIGLWTALKTYADGEPGRSLLILKHHDPGRVAAKDWPVAVITNIEGMPAEFESLNDAVAQVVLFLSRFRDQFRAAEAPDSISARRVKRTLGAHNGEWRDALRTKCISIEGECAFRAASTRAIAEFHRMLEANRSMSEVVVVLGGLAHRCEDLMRTLRQSRGDMFHQRAALDRLDDAVARIRVVSKSLATREFADRRVGLTEEETRDCFPRFLLTLMSSAERGRDPELRRRAQRARRKLEPFCDWAQKFLDSNDQYANTSLYRGSGVYDSSRHSRYDPFAEEIGRQGASARDIADVVDALATHYYDACADRMEHGLKAEPSAADPLTVMLENLNASLPHNAEEAHLDIWRLGSEVV